MKNNFKILVLGLFLGFFSKDLLCVKFCPFPFLRGGLFFSKVMPESLISHYRLSVRKAEELELNVSSEIGPEFVEIVLKARECFIEGASVMGIVLKTSQTLAEAKDYLDELIQDFWLESVRNALEHLSPENQRKIVLYALKMASADYWASLSCFHANELFQESLFLGRSASEGSSAMFMGSLLLDLYNQAQKEGVDPCMSIKESFKISAFAGLYNACAWVFCNKTKDDVDRACMVDGLGQEVPMRYELMYIQRIHFL